VEITI